MARELELFAGAGTDVVSAASQVAIPAIEGDALANVTLQPQADIAFAHAPERVRGTGAAYGGMVQFSPPVEGSYRVTLSAAAWVDVVRESAIVSSRRFVGKLTCARIHKSVEYALRAGSPVIIQISGSPMRQIRVAVTRVM
jgi:hypothetical protein